MTDVNLSEFVDVNLSTADAAAEAFGFGAVLGVFNLDATEGDRSFGPYTSLTDLDDDDLDAATEPHVNAWASAIFAQETHVDTIYVADAFAADASYTATLAAAAASVGPENFYFVNLETRLEASILLAAAWAEAFDEDTPKILIAQTSDAAALAGTAGNVMLDLEAAGYNRTACIYHQYNDSTEGAVVTDGHLDAAWTSRCGGFNLDSNKGAGTWAFKSLSGVTRDPLTAAQYTAIKNAGGNAYGRTKGLSFTSPGQMASGRFIDVQTSLDWGRIRIGEAMLNEFVNEPNKIPYTEAGINRCRAVAMRVLAEDGVKFGHFSPDVMPTLTAPKVVDTSSAVKATRALTFTGTVTLAGGIHKVTYNISVST